MSVMAAFLHCPKRSFYGFATQCKSCFVTTVNRALWHCLPTVPPGLTEGLLFWATGDLRSAPRRCREPPPQRAHGTPPRHPSCQAKLARTLDSVERAGRTANLVYSTLRFAR